MEVEFNDELSYTELDDTDYVMEVKADSDFPICRGVKPVRKYIIAGRVFQRTVVALRIL